MFATYRYYRENLLKRNRQLTIDQMTEPPLLSRIIEANRLAAEFAWVSTVTLQSIRLIDGAYSRLDKAILQQNQISIGKYREDAKLIAAITKGDFKQIKLAEEYLSRYQSRAQDENWVNRYRAFLQLHILHIEGTIKAFSENSAAYLEKAVRIVKNPEFEEQANALLADIKTSRRPSSARPSGSPDNSPGG